MIKKTITYTNYNTGEQITGDFYFNLNKAELMRMEMGVNGGFTEKINQIVESKNAPEIMALFEDIIQKSYGVKTPEGGFVKRKEYLEAFMATDAYSELFMELATDADKAAEFVNGIVPADIAKKAAEHPALNN
jgi:hypothetical protein